MILNLLGFLLVIAGGVAIMLFTVALSRAWTKIGVHHHSNTARPGSHH
jgi:hypothetical protein